MITKGRSPTMTHVSRNHRVALDWLFDRINLDPKIQIHYIDTKPRLADMLTKGNFTREEWNNLSFVQYHPFQLHLLYQEFQFAKLLHNGEEDSKSKRRGSGCVQVATSSSYLMPPSSCAASSPIASKSPGTSGASGRLGSRMNIAASSFDAASASQVQIMYTEYTPRACMTCNTVFSAFRACTMEEKINEIYLQLPLFIQNAARIENVRPNACSNSGCTVDQDYKY